jgi:hypothetical protein
MAWDRKNPMPFYTSYPNRCKMMWWSWLRKRNNKI